MQAIPIPRRRTTHDATSTSPRPATPALTRPHPAASPPTTSPLQSPPTPTPPRRRHSCPHPADAATDPADSTSTPPQPPPPCPQATHLAAASTQSPPHPAASAPHLLPHFPGLHPSYYIVASCTFISYIILHE